MKKLSSAENIKILLKTYTGVTGKKISVGLLTTIGNQVGVSREYVRQVAVKEKYIMPHKVAQLRKAKCRECGKPFPVVGSYTRICCSPKCYKKRYQRLYWTTTKCKFCGGDIKYLKSLEKSGRKPVFCNKCCQGGYLGNLNKGKERKRFAKWRMGASNLKKLFPSTFTASQFAKKLDYSAIASSFISAILKELRNKNIIKRVPSLKIGKRKRGSLPYYYRVITSKKGNRK